MTDEELAGLSEQQRREIVTSVDMYAHEAEAARRKVDGAQDKINKFKGHLAGLEDDLKRAKQELTAAEKTHDEARDLAETVLARGPVNIRGIEVRAMAGVAGATAHTKGGGN